MITVLAANDFGDDLGDGVAGPVGLLIIVLLVIALVFLMRSMNKHLRRVRDEFPDDETLARMRAAELASRAGSRPARSASRTATGKTAASDASTHETLPGDASDGRVNGAGDGEIPADSAGHRDPGGH